LDGQLLTFITVVEKKSFSQAARELHLTQPAVTTQIQNLEKYYGVRLLHRDYKFVELTPAGRILYEYAKQILALYEQAQAEMRKLGGLIHGRLNIGATYTIAEFILPHLVGLFKKEFPETKITLYMGNKEEVCRYLAESRCDIVLAAGDCQNRHITCEKLLTDTLVLVVPPNHPWAERGTIFPSELYQERFILREPGSSCRQLWEKSLKEVGLDPTRLKVIMELNSHEAIKRCVELNFGVAVLSEWVIIKEVNLGLLTKVYVEGLSLERNINLVYPKGKIPPLTQEFLRFCRRNKEELLKKLEQLGSPGKWHPCVEPLPILA